jgi:hypothetical protein
MAIAFVQAPIGVVSGAASPTIQFGSNTTSGNFIVVGVMIAGAGQTVNTIADSGGVNTYTKAIAFAPANGFSVEIWYALNITGGTTPTITVNTINGGNNMLIEIYEFSGVATSSPADGAGATGSGTSTSCALSAGLTTTNANDLLIAFNNCAQTGTAGPASFTTETNFFQGAYRIVSATSTYTSTFTQSPSDAFGVALFAFKASAGATPVNATVAIAATAKFATITPRVTKDATFFCAAGAAATFRCDLGVFGHAILQGKATSTTFTGQSTQLKTERAQGKATATLAPFVTHNASVAIQGSAGASRFNAGSNPTQVNATVHLFGFAANNVVINQFIGRAFLTLRATIPLYQVSINGRATLTPNPQVTRNSTLSVLGKAKLTLAALVTGPGAINATLVIQGRARFTTISPRVMKGAQVVIEAGNPIFIPVQGKVSLMGRARMTLNPLVTKGPQVLIQGRVTLTPNPTLGGTNNIFGGVHFAGRATARFFIPPSSIPGTLRVLGRAFLTPVATNVVSLSATVAIRGRAAGFFSGFTQGGTFNNAVVNLAGRAITTASAFRLVQPTVGISGLANMGLFPGGTLRATLAIQGFASFIPQVPKQLLQWSSGNTLQYKVWQYNTENMVRVLGSSWTATSVGLSFQALAFEIVSTEAGWGS